MALVAGVDCSTQSTKVLICDSETGEVVRQGRAPHPDATEVDPAIWWSALQESSSGLLDGVEAMAVGGQQHGMVTLDADGQVVRPALLWNDTRSADAATELLDELGGPQAWVDAVGLVPVASFTITKLRWLAEHEPDEAKRVEQVLLPHDWLTWKLSGQSISPTTDRGDASGTGYWSAATGEYRMDFLRHAFGRDLGVPAIAAPKAIVGHTPDGIALAAGTGDNMAAALGLGLGPGDVVVSLGTSGTVFAVAEGPTADPSGYVAGFADATGRFLPLVCTLNAARVLTAAADLLGVDLDRLSELALASTAGAGGLTLLPYLDGERTPDLPDETGRITGLTRANARPQNLARAAVEGMLLGLADGLDAVRQHGVPVRRALLIGGAAMSPAVRAVASGILGVPVEVPAPGEYVALGAARQAAWALSGSDEAPQWSVAAEKAPDAADDYAPVRARYAQFRTGVQELSARQNKS
ncbi:xylulokinase [Cryptosporangium phraense]|uniref:Xylulose kinase n=1 Tax=Cryptosporangium phraense TaxID=2593070 RepID=A0A545AFI9_9ACTN|nr:xylulokinase [Cryptosporangium phraense]TQS40030.1 xylulokinase [Cryptosporangium phraense]